MTVISGFNDDTVQACRAVTGSNTDMVEAYISAAMYVNGMGKPHYPPPAICDPDSICERDPDPLCERDHDRPCHECNRVRACWSY